jgi:outer membrane autotransporter protein
MHGTKEFTFENNGSFNGNVTLTTVGGLIGNYTNVYGESIAKENSKVTLIPTITGSGADSTLAVPSTNIAGMGDVLTIAGTGTVTVAPKTLVTVHAGEYFLVANTLTLTGGATLPHIDSENTPLVNWNIATNTGNLVVGVDSINSASTIAGVSARGGAAIDALMAGNSTVGGALQGLTVAADIAKAGEQLRPEANNASTQAAMSAANQVSSVIGMHQDQVRTASNGKSGVSTGEAAQGVGFWMQGFGFKGDQNQRGGVDGYSANTGGFVFGADSAIGNGDLRIGAALAYGSTTIDGQGITTANRTNIDSYQGNVYGSWNAGTWYVDAALGYGQHQYKTKRYVALAGANMSGNHDADQYSAKIGVGYPLAMGNVTLTPLAALSYVHLDQAGYSETDATNSGAALTIGDTKTDSFRSGLGAKVSLPLSTGTVKTALEARAIWNHEFADTNQDIAARFAGGTSFTTNGVSQARDSANLGLGLSMNSANGQTLSVNYDADVRSSYFGQTASVKFRYDF